MMRTNEINIRDPYILLHGDRYYLYGTRSASCWGLMDGFDCYVSDDLENWSDPSRFSITMAISGRTEATGRRNATFTGMPFIW